MINQKFINFLLFVEKLKEQKRKGWLIKTNQKETESIADHSYATAMIGMIVGDYLRLDTNKIIRMALLHDLCEAIIGDQIPNENPHKENQENNAILKILSTLPEEIKNRYIRIWNEFKNCETKESQIVHEIDKLELILQAGIYRKSMKDESLNEFFQSAESNIDSEFNKEFMNFIFKYFKE